VLLADGDADTPHVVVGIGHKPHPAADAPTGWSSLSLALESQRKVEIPLADNANLAAFDPRTVGGRL
jgi:hypothetical protein